MHIEPLGLVVVVVRCAGLCEYEGHGGLCCIKLSEPLLKFRPRKDLVETLLVGWLAHKTVSESLDLTRTHCKTYRFRPTLLVLAV